MQLIDYLKLYKDFCEIQTVDVETERLVSAIYIKELETGKEVLYKKVPVAYLKGCFVYADYKALISANKQLFQNYIKDKYELEESDEVEMTYILTSDFDKFINDRLSQDEHMRLYQLLEKCV